MGEHVEDQLASDDHSHGRRSGLGPPNHSESVGGSKQAMFKLQRSAGNRAVVALVNGRARPTASLAGSPPLAIQRHPMAKSSTESTQGEEEEDEQDESGHSVAQRSVPARRPSVQRSATARATKPGASTTRSVASPSSTAALAPSSVQRIAMPAWWTKWQEKRKAKAAQKKEDAYNVAPGQKLPTLRYAVDEKMKEVMKFDRDAVAEHAVKEMVPAGLELIEDEAAMVKLYEAAIGQLKVTTPPLPDGATWIRPVRQLLATVLSNMGPDDNFLDATNRVSMEAMKLPKDALDRRPLNKFIHSFQGAANTRAQQLAEIRAPNRREEGAYQNMPGGDNPVNAFIEDRSSVKLAHASVPETDLAGFAGALKKMPTVALLLDGGGKGGESKPQQGRVTSGWKDGGDLLGKVKYVNDLVAPKKYLAEKRFKSRSLQSKITQADQAVRTVVNPGILGSVPRPQINVHATTAQAFTAPWGFRAFASGDEIHVAYNEDMDVISHELGHAIENRLPMAAFHDVHLLLSERHIAAGGGDTAVESASVFTPKEGRYAGKYATGKYTSTVYKDDSNEVISMAMQFFSTPENARKIVDKDPQHAALVLRIMRADEYSSTDALRPYDKYLPQKTAPSMLDRYAEAQRKTDALFGIGR